jgi:hypothetical protein
LPGNLIDKAGAAGQENDDIPQIDQNISHVLPLFHITLRALNYS